MRIYIVLWDCNCKPCWPPDHEIWRCPLGNCCKNQGSRQVCKLFSKRCRGKAFSLPTFPESASVASRCLANLKPVPRVKALGQVDGLFSEAGGTYVSVCCLCSALGIVAFPELSGSHGARKHKHLWPQGAGDRGVSPMWIALAHQL